MNKIISQYVFASAFLLATSAVSLFGINTAHAQSPTLTINRLANYSLQLNWENIRTDNVFNILIDESGTISKISQIATGTTPSTIIRSFLFRHNSNIPNLRKAFERANVADRLGVSGNSGTDNRVDVQWVSVPNPSLNVERLSDNSLKLTWGNIRTTGALYYTPIIESGTRNLVGLSTTAKTLNIPDDHTHVARINAADQICVVGSTRERMILSGNGLCKSVPNELPDPSLTVERLVGNSIRLTWDGIRTSPLIKSYQIFVKTGTTETRINFAFFFDIKTVVIDPGHFAFNQINNADRVGVAGRLNTGSGFADVDKTFQPVPALLSADAKLSALTLSAGTLSPNFAAATTNYTASVGNDVANIMFTPTTNHNGATVSVAGNPVNSGSASGPITLTVGTNAIAIVVTSQDGTMKTYTVTMTRDANIAPSIVTSTTVDYAENADTPVTTFTATDANGNTVTWSLLLTSTDAGAFGIDRTNGVLTFRASPDYETKSTYTVTVVATDDGEPSMSSEREVTVTIINVDEPGTIGPITGIAQVGEQLTAGTITDPDSPSSPVTVTTYQWIAGGFAISGAISATYTLTADKVGDHITVIVTYTDGEGPNKSVTSDISDAVIAGTLSADANLISLTISAGTLSPTFDFETINYAVSLGNDMTSVTLTPNVLNGNITGITVNGMMVVATIASDPINLDVGTNVINIVVTAQDGTTKTYTVTVTRDAVGISNLDGESNVSIKDAKFLYYAHALDLTPEDSATLTKVLGPLTNAENNELGNLLTAAKSLLPDLNGDGETDTKDATILYYSFALEPSLGDGTDTKPGLEEIKRAILGPLTGTDDPHAINAILRRVYDEAREPL